MEDSRISFRSDFGRQPCDIVVDITDGITTVEIVANSQNILYVSQHNDGMISVRAKHSVMIIPQASNSFLLKDFEEASDARQ